MFYEKCAGDKCFSDRRRQMFVTFWPFSPRILAAAHTLRCSCGLRLPLCAYALLMRQMVKKNMKQGKVAGRGF